MAERPRTRVESAAGGWVKNLGSNDEVIIDSNNVGEYQQWDIIRGMPGFYVFSNFATRYFIGRQGSNEIICAPNVPITQWSLEATPIWGYSIIRVKDEDLVWTVIDGNHIELRPADPTCVEQRFRWVSEST